MWKCGRRIAQALLIGAVALFATASAQQIPIGLLLPLTGGGAPDGPFLRNAAQLAVDEVNAMLTAAGNSTTFTLLMEDDRTTPEGGLEAIESVVNAGAQLVISSYSSAATSGARAYANANEVLLIAAAATSPALAIPDDWLYRLITPDILQATAAAQLMAEEGIDHLVVLHRGDSYGLGLAEPLKANFESYGGSVTLLAYDPDLTDFAAEVDEMAREVRRLNGQIAAMIISFQPDGLNILGHARLNDTLNNVRWFGSKDALSPVFFPPIAPEEVSQFMVDMSLTGFFPTPPDNPVRQAFERNYQERFGTPPTPWSLYMYDAIWVSALTVLTSGEYSGPNLRAALPQVAAHYIGASGHKLLNSDGDSAIGVYELMVSREVDGALVPVTIGLWDSGTGVITRFE